MARASIVRGGSLALGWFVASCAGTPPPRSGAPEPTEPELACAAGDLARAGSLAPQSEEVLSTARLDPGDRLTVALQADPPQGIDLMLRSRHVTVVELAEALVDDAERARAAAPALHHEVTVPGTYRVLLLAGDEAVRYQACVRITRRAGHGSVADAGTLR